VKSRKKNQKEHHQRNSGKGNPKYRLTEQEANLIREY